MIVYRLPSALPEIKPTNKKTVKRRPLMLKALPNKFWHLHCFRFQENYAGEEAAQHDDRVGDEGEVQDR